MVMEDGEENDGREREREGIFEDDLYGDFGRGVFVRFALFRWVLVTGDGTVCMASCCNICFHLFVPLFCVWVCSVSYHFVSGLWPCFLSMNSSFLLRTLLFR